MNKLKLLKGNIPSEHSKQLTSNVLRSLPERLDILSELMENSKEGQLTTTVGMPVYDLYEKDLNELGIYILGKPSDYIGNIPNEAKIAMANIIDCVNDDTIIDLGVFGEIKIFNSKASHPSSVKTNGYNLSSWEVIPTKKQQKYSSKSIPYCFFSIIAPTSEFVSRNAPEAVDPILLTIIEYNGDLYELEIARWI